MTKDTKRDQIWDAALRLALDGEEFTTEELLPQADLDYHSSRTAEDVLRTMREFGWLDATKRTGGRPGWRRAWVAGERLAE